VLLRELGYEIEPGASGAPEIRGYSAEYLEASSRRRQQIKEHMAEQGGRFQQGDEAVELLTELNDIRR
jgi:conjugative relaxase-like TrwC/TraI family protein